MPQSRGAVVLAVAFALIGAASAGLGATAIAATAPRAQHPPGTSPFPTPSPLSTQSPIDTITIVSATSTPVTGGVQLSVTANSTTPIVTMNAHMLDATTSDDVLDVAMAQSSTGPNPGDSTWTATLTEGTPPTGLPLGTYNITVDAADAGTSVTGVPEGPFAFQETASILSNPVNTVISHSNQHPTVSGTVTVSGPGITTSTAYTGPLVLQDSGGNVPLTLNSSGGYSYTFTNPEPGETFAIGVPPSTTVAGASTQPAAFTVHDDPLKIAASLSAKAVTYGGRVTVGGTVSYEPATAFVPIAGVTVNIYDRAAAPRPVATAVTDGNGHFSANLPKEPASVHWVLQAGGPYLNTATVTLPMKVSLPTVISGFQATLSQFWQVSYRGCLALPAHVPGYVQSLAGLVIQYAPKVTGPWRTLGAVPRQKSVLCGNGGMTFGGTLNAKLNYAYYRAVYAGGTDVAGTGYLSSASGKVLAWKYEDRITAFSVSPLVLPRNGTLTVAGQLQYFSGKWRDYARQTVYIILRPKGSSTWYYIAVASTNPAGRFRVSFADPVTATWSAEFFGNSAHLATLAPDINVRVT